MAGGKCNPGAFVARLELDGASVSYATFLGGSGRDDGCALALDAAGRATVAGTAHALSLIHI